MKKTEEQYKKQNTAVFKSATERLVFPLQAKVSLFICPVLPLFSLSLLKLLSLKRVYCQRLTLLNGTSQLKRRARSARGPVFPALHTFFFFSHLKLISAAENRSHVPIISFSFLFCASFFLISQLLGFI